MYLFHFLYKVICFWILCLSLTLAVSREDLAQDFLEQIMKTPKPEKVLNSVLGRLHRSRQGLLERPKPKFNDDPECCDESVILPEYTEYLADSQERGIRQLGSEKYQEICRSKRRIRRLNTEEYEYRPAYYEEVRCNRTSDEEGGVMQQICQNLGLSCVQWNKTIHLSRRRYTSECWETKTLVIPAGCECMWPEHILGDISLHA